MRPATSCCANRETGRLARHRKPGEVFGLHFLLAQSSTNLLHFADMIYRFHLLDVHRIDVVKAQRIQAFSGKFSIVAGISE